MALRGTLTHRKTRRLARILGIDPPAALGYLEALWHVTSEKQPDGGIGRMSDEDIAEEMFCDCFEPSKIINALVESGWLDMLNSCRLYVHDFHEHSDDTTDNKLARSITRYANGALPRMKRLAEPERQKLIAQFTTQSHEEPRASHEKPLPESGALSGARASIQNPDPVERAQECAAPDSPPSAREVIDSARKVRVIDSPPQHSLDETYQPVVELAKQFWPDWVPEDLISAHHAWRIMPHDDRQLCIANLKRRIELGQDSQFIAKTFAKYLASPEWKRKPREPTGGAISRKQAERDAVWDQV